MLKFGTPTIALPLAIKKCTVQTGCTVYIFVDKKKFERYYILCTICMYICLWTKKN